LEAIAFSMNAFARSPVSVAWTSQRTTFREDVQHHVKIEVKAAPLGFQLGDVPRPDPVRAVRDELGADAGRAAWARRSRTSFLASRTRYMVRILQ
jgi:hypothetical protein